VTGSTSAFVGGSITWDRPAVVPLPAGTPSWRHAFGLAGDYWQTAMPLGTYVNEREKLDAEWQEPGSVEVHTDPAAVRGFPPARATSVTVRAIRRRLG